MRYSLISVATAMALASTASLAIAQQAPGDKDKSPAARERTPDSKGPREPGATQQRGAPEQPRATEQPRRDQPRATERPDRDRPKATERPDRDQPRATERPDRDRPKATERPDKDRPKATERPDKDRPKATEGPDRDRPKAAEPEIGKHRRVQVTEKQRTDVGVRLRQTRVEKTRVNISVNIGSRVPRSVRLRPLPAAVFAVTPVYRGYSYVVLEDETIVIVEPGTYVIVDVIPAETRRVERPRPLALSAEQMRFIYEAVPRSRTADVRVRLALGAEVPRSLPLLRFPEEVVERVPEVRPYRFVVTADDDVAIVDPTDNAIVLVISE